MSSSEAGTAQDKPNFLPDLGSAVVAVRIVLVAQVIAVVIAVARHDRLDAGAWHDFLMVTGVCQLIAAGSVVALRLIAAPVRRMSLAAGATLAGLVLVLVSALVTEALVFALFQLGHTGGRWPEWHLSLLARNLIISALISVLALRYMIVYQRAQVEQQSKQTERLQALQSRIRPHFLFNSMNSVASLIPSDPELAEKALQDLADVFRVILADARNMVPITVENELARQYLDIEKLRLGDRLHVKWTASNVPRSAQIPALTLQPILENAVYHGIEPSFAGGTIRIQMWTEEDMLNIMVSNPVPELNKSSRARGNRIALDNVRERLVTHFGRRASLQNLEKLGHYHVKISIPVVRG